MAERNYGLATGVGLFVDDETGLKLVPGKSIKIDRSLAGERTNMAIQHGALVEVDLSKEKKDDSDIPDDFPGRDAFVKEGLSFDEVKRLSPSKLDAIPNVGKKTIEAVEKWVEDRLSK